jgi:hypothetical protein
MTTRPPRNGVPPVDPAALRHDELLIEAISRGELVHPDEAIATLLSAWQVEVTQAAARTRPPGLPCLTPVSPRGRRRPAVPPRTQVRAGWLAAAAVTVTAGLGLATLNATPDSPLWPVTKTVFPERAGLVLAQQAIQDARRAAAEGRYGETRRHLERATMLLNDLEADRLTGQLRSEISTIRASLPGSTAGPTQPPRPDGSRPTGQPDGGQSDPAAPATGQPDEEQPDTGQSNRTAPPHESGGPAGVDSTRLGRQPAVHTRTHEPAPPDRSAHPR